MKKQWITMVLAMLVFVACNTTPKGDKTTTSAEQEVASATGSIYSVDTTSAIGFIGNGVGKNHPGKFKIKEGNLTVTDGKVSAGSFVIDITSLSLDEQAEMIQTKLKGHLLSPDFFDVQKHPTAKFEITKVVDYTSNGTDKSIVEGANFLVSGNLTLKDTTNNITFPAKIDVTETDIIAKANFNIDRTLWKMSYGNDKSLKDKFISPEVNLVLDFKAKK
ncbi:MAG: YceI family protein [Chitinophagales bacterium]|nr:YceI family protein [Bacteroidota bacterium]